MKYIQNRLVIFIIVSIVSQFLSLTIILLLVSILMLVNIVVDDVEPARSIPGAVNIIRSRLFDIVAFIRSQPLVIIIFTAIVIVERYVLRYVFYPYIGHLLTTIVDIIVRIAVIDVYLKNKKTQQQ